ncbi:hypothetical protein [Neobacillus terrae]|uniref:hypothetical protein n=1 Tax=Neobacillus terrae TaxID=3034837 RepID=UPI00140DD176|nr:hypothetical protein [Neobacillus terrae]NHM32077.1 hypothetical protein [Neobacillus terrae]
MLAIKKKIENEGVYITKFLEFNNETIKEGTKIFEEYRKNKIILNDSFFDNEWIITNQVITKIFDFTLPQTLFESEKKSSRELGSFQDFKNVIKVYFVFELQTNALLQLNVRFNAFKNVIKYTRYFSSNSSAEDVIKGRKRLDEKNLLLLKTCLEILDFYPIPETENFQEDCSITYEEIREKILVEQRNKGLEQRFLSEFQSIFFFDKLLNQFWDIQASSEEKALYFPIYLWWKITMVLPLRPTEFVIIPFDCIREINTGEYMLKIRRSNLKGGKTEVTHKLEFDYTIHEYPISIDIANMIFEYKSLVEKYGEREFLFSLSAYRDLTGLENFFKLNKFGTRHLSSLIGKFYKKVIQEQFGIKVLQKPFYAQDKNAFLGKDEFLKPNEIMMIQIGDTRHFSMINLVLNDFNPILIKDFAGHKDINISYHYFNHIGKVVKCMAYFKFQELKKRTIDFGIEENSINKEVSFKSILRGLELQSSDKCKELDYGKCYSKKFFVGDVSDCLPVFGDCLVCNHFIKSSDEFNTMIKKRRKQLENRINDEGLFLFSVLKSFNKTHKEAAEFKRRILNIQQSAAEYLKLTENLNVGDIDE